MKKLVILLAVGVGYVLGARAGRERYEQIRDLAFRVKDDPRVRETTQHAADVAKQQAPVVGEKVSTAASSVASTVTEKVKSATSGSSDEDLKEQLPDESLVHQDDMGPRGDLP